MENSKLIDCKVMSPNHSGKRTHSVDRITPHCVVGQLKAENIGACFINTSRQASCNYGIGTDGRVVLCVDEDNRSWCSSSRDNDHRAITIECASDSKPPYAFNTSVYNKLVELCADICRRYDKEKLIWIGDKTKALNYSPKKNEIQLTVHQWFAPTACPGGWLMNKMNVLASDVTAKLKPKAQTTSTKKTLYCVQVGAYKIKANAEIQAKKLKSDSFQTYVCKIGDLYKVQVGAYSVRKNADDMLKKIKAKGYSAFIQTKEV